MAQMYKTPQRVVPVYNTPPVVAPVQATRTTVAQPTSTVTPLRLQLREGPARPVVTTGPRTTLPSISLAPVTRSQEIPVIAGTVSGRETTARRAGMAETDEHVTTFRAQQSTSTQPRTFTMNRHVERVEAPVDDTNISDSIIDMLIGRFGGPIDTYLIMGKEKFRNTPLYEPYVLEAEEIVSRLDGRTDDETDIRSVIFHIQDLFLKYSMLDAPVPTTRDYSERYHEAVATMTDLINKFGKNDNMLRYLTDPEIAKLKELAYIYFVDEVSKILEGNSLSNMSGYKINEVLVKIHNSLRKYINIQDYDYPFTDRNDFFDALTNYMQRRDSFPIFTNLIRETGSLYPFFEENQELMSDPQWTMDELMSTIIYTTYDMEGLGEVFELLISKGATPNLDILFAFADNDPIEGLITTVNRAVIIDSLSRIMPLDVNNYYDWDSLVDKYPDELEDEISRNDNITPEAFTNYMMTAIKHYSEYLKALPRKDDSITRMEDQRISAQLRPYYYQLMTKGQLSEKTQVQFDNLMRGIVKNLYIPEEYSSLFDKNDPNSLYGDPFLLEILKGLNTIIVKKTSKL